MNKEIKETREEKFKRLSTDRAKKVKKALRVLARCSGYEYAYTHEEVNKLFKSIKKEVEEAEILFREELKQEINIKIDPKFLIDLEGKRIGVNLSLEDYNKMIEEIRNYKCIEIPESNNC